LLDGRLERAGANAAPTTAKGLGGGAGPTASDKFEVASGELTG
jgi:hypothetical protein